MTKHIRDYPIDLKLTLKPIWFDKKPNVKIRLDNWCTELVLSEIKDFNFSIIGTKNQEFVLDIEHLGKSINDTDVQNNLDTAVVVEKIEFNGISSQKFIWQGIYYPHYPEHYIKEHRAENLSPAIKNCSYLGWNGVWQLKFTAPIFTWIHKIENLGWIHN